MNGEPLDSPGNSGSGTDHLPGHQIPFGLVSQMAGTGFKISGSNDLPNQLGILFDEVHPFLEILGGTLHQIPPQKSLLFLRQPPFQERSFSWTDQLKGASGLMDKGFQFGILFQQTQHLHRGRLPVGSHPFRKQQHLFRCQKGIGPDRVVGEDHTRRWIIMAHARMAALAESQALPF